MRKPIFVFVKKSEEDKEQYCLKTDSDIEKLIWQQTRYFENSDLKITLLDNEYPDNDKLTIEQIIEQNEDNLSKLIIGFIEFVKRRIEANSNVDKIYIYVHFGGGTQENFDKARNKIQEIVKKNSDISFLSALSLTLKQPSGDDGFEFLSSSDKSKTTIIIPTSINDWKKIVTIKDEIETENDNSNTATKAYEIDTEKKKYIDAVSGITSMLDAWTLLCQAICIAPENAKKLFASKGFKRKDWWACGGCIEILKDWLSLDDKTEILYKYVNDETLKLDKNDFCLALIKLLEIKQKIINGINKIDSSSNLIPFPDNDLAINKLRESLR